LNSVLIVAEMSANHLNDFNIAKKTIEQIHYTGADAVKVQTYKPSSLSLEVDNEFFSVKKDGPWKGLRPWDLYASAAMPYEWHFELKEYAESLGLTFFSSPFDLDAIDFLESIQIPIYKIASFEINDIPLIKKAASTQKPIIISTGVATESDIEKAIKTCHDVGNNDITILKCTSEYPAEISAANLKTITDMQNRFKVKVGVSDHTMGFIVPVVAVTLGATVVEKHFTLDRSLGGPDAFFSMEPHEFKEMVDKIRQVEMSLGRVTYDIQEKDLRRRRSLFAIRDIMKGEIFSLENIKSLRPCVGLEPILLPKVLSCRASVDIPKGQPITIDLLSVTEI